MNAEILSAAMLLATQQADAPTAYAPPAPPLPSPVYTAPQRLGTDVPLIGEDDYPKAAMFSDAEGVTALMLTIGANGRPTGCQIMDSSGHAVLDVTACTLVRQRARFAPGTLNGKPVESRWRSRIVWKMPDEGHVMVDPRAAGSAKTAPVPRYALLDIDPRAAVAGSGMAGTAGRTNFVWLDVDTVGKVMRCTLDGGDGEGALAARACPLFLGQKLFVPGFDRDGNAVPDRVRVKVRW